jgi:hypothetical protein
MRAIRLGAWALAGLLLLQTGPAVAQETAHEILVGYNSEQDRQAGEKELATLRDKLKVRGQSVESLRIQAISDKALKLRVGLPPALKAEIARTPAVEAAIIQELAAQVKRADKRIVYAHPNWIMGSMPPAARDLFAPSPRQTADERRASAEPRKPASSAASRKQAKHARVAKKKGKAKAKVARKRARVKLAARPRCRCWQEVAWTMPCAGGRSWRVAHRGYRR